MVSKEQCHSKDAEILLSTFAMRLLGSGAISIEELKRAMLVGPITIVPFSYVIIYSILLSYLLYIRRLWGRIPRTRSVLGLWHR